jgi:hypothetical protein
MQRPAAGRCLLIVLEPLWPPVSSCAFRLGLAGFRLQISRAIAANKRTNATGIVFQVSAVWEMV